VSDEVLVAHAVGAFTEMPLWLPASRGAGTGERDSSIS